MKLRTKRIAALGMSTMMMSSMAIGVQAADANVRVNNNASGNTTVEGSADVAVDGWITDTNPDDITSSYDTSQSNNPQSSGAPGGTNASTTSWGDDSTIDTTQLIITAPTKLTFMAAGKGADAKLLDKTVEGNVVKGQINNQSCYVAANKSVVPKKVDVAAKTTAGTENFSLTEKTGNYVNGVKLHVGDGNVDFGSTVGSDYKNVTTLAAGTIAKTADRAMAVNGSKSDVYFAGEGKDNKVTTGFADDYQSGDSLHSNYKLNLKYAVVK